MDIWVRGTTHPAPLSRQRVQEIAASTETLTVQGYVAPSPKLLSMDGAGRGLAAAVVLRIRPDGTAGYEPVARYDETTRTLAPVPVNLGAPTDRVFLVLFATGARDRSSMTAVNVKIGGLASEVLYAGPQGSYAGLDQINVRLSPRLAGRGEVTIELSVNGQSSNIATVHIG
jgi:uncharacterized protein (TIGR03437 family)